MPQLRSATSTSGRNMAGARALWRATGMTDSDFGKPIIAIANSFTEFVPGHVHLRDLGKIVAEEIKAAGGVAKEFNTIAVDDGIAMGHGGMLYSLPSRELIADAVEYMVQAHCADAIVCISNCDKITPGMLLAALRLNIPVVFVSGGPMEAGKTTAIEGIVHSKLDLVDAMVAAANDTVTDEQLDVIERSACPTCGSCSGMFTANSMNCLTEAMGLALPGNGSTLATHAKRRALFEEAGRVVVELAKRYYENDDESVLPRNIAQRSALGAAGIAEVGQQRQFVGADRCFAADDVVQHDSGDVSALGVADQTELRGRTRGGLFLDPRQSLSDRALNGLLVRDLAASYSTTETCVVGHISTVHIPACGRDRRVQNLGQEASILRRISVRRRLTSALHRVHHQTRAAPRLRRRRGHVPDADIGHGNNGRRHHGQGRRPDRASRVLSTPLDRTMHLYTGHRDSPPSDRQGAASSGGHTRAVRRQINRARA